MYPVVKHKVLTHCTMLHFLVAKSLSNFDFLNNGSNMWMMIHGSLVCMQGLQVSRWSLFTYPWKTEFFLKVQSYAMLRGKGGDLEAFPSKMPKRSFIFPRFGTQSWKYQPWLICLRKYRRKSTEYCKCHLSRKQETNGWNIQYQSQYMYLPTFTG